MQRPGKTGFTGFACLSLISLDVNISLNEYNLIITKPCME